MAFNTNAFTFQYVSILISSMYFHRFSSSKFTFQYVSILMNPPGGMGLKKNYIYIPICFYFNEKKPVHG